jgi:hypothetical protein
VVKHPLKPQDVVVIKLGNEYFSSLLDRAPEKWVLARPRGVRQQNDQYAD